MDKTLMAVLGVVIGLGLFMAFSQMVQAEEPITYTCPICGVEFATYDLLYGHFTAEHPSEPIDIIWEG